MPSPLRLWLIALSIAAAYCATQVGIAHPSDREQYALARSLGLHLSLDADPLWSAEPADSNPSAPHTPAYPAAAIAAIPFHWFGAAFGHLYGAEITSRLAGPAAQGAVAAAACAMAAAALLVFLTCLELGCRPRAAAFAMLGFAFASLALPMAARLVETAFATVVVTGFFYGYLRLRSGWDTPAQQIGLGLCMGAAPLASELTLLLTPAFAALILLQGRKLTRPASRFALVLVPALAGWLVWALYAAALAGGTTGPSQLVSEAVARHTARSPLVGVFNLFLSGQWRLSDLAMIFAWPSSPFAVVRPGLLFATPAIGFALLGILNLRAEPLTRRPLYALLAVVAGWCLLAGGNRQLALDAEKYATVLIPITGLLFVLVGSFIDYHLMTMRGLLFKPIFIAAFSYATLLGLMHAAGIVLGRTLGSPEPWRLAEIFTDSPAGMPAWTNIEALAALLFPVLPNLPVLLPPVGLALAAPLAVRPVLRWAVGRDIIKAPPSGKPSETKRRGRLTDREMYEQQLAETAREGKAAQPVTPPTAEPAGPVTKPFPVLRAEEDDGDDWIH